MDKDKQMLISLTYSVRDLKKMKSPVILSTDNFIIFNTSMHQKNLTYLGSQRRFLSPTFPVYPVFLLRK